MRDENIYKVSNIISSRYQNIAQYILNKLPELVNKTSTGKSHHALMSRQTECVTLMAAHKGNGGMEAGG